MWNRLRYVKNPETGKRVSRINPPEDWIVTEVPELRIVDDDLWQAVKHRQGEITEQYATVIEATQTALANRLNGAHRPSPPALGPCSSAVSAAGPIPCAARTATAARTTS